MRFYTSHRNARGTDIGGSVMEGFPVSTQGEYAGVDAAIASNPDDRSMDRIRLVMTGGRYGYTSENLGFIVQTQKGYRDSVEYQPSQYVIDRVKQILDAEKAEKRSEAAKKAAATRKRRQEQFTNFVTGTITPSDQAPAPPVQDTGTAPRRNAKSQFAKAAPAPSVPEYADYNQFILANGPGTSFTDYLVMIRDGKIRRVREDGSDCPVSVQELDYIRTMQRQNADVLDVEKAPEYVPVTTGNSFGFSGGGGGGGDSFSSNFITLLTGNISAVPAPVKPAVAFTRSERNAALQPVSEIPEDYVRRYYDDEKEMYVYIRD